MIKFNKPVTASGLKFVKNLNHFSADGPYTKKCQKWLNREIKCKESLLVHSCTAALEMCALLLNIKENDEVIMPSYTFVSTANAFILRGGKPVFIDIDPGTCNIDPSKIKPAITKKTKAIVVVHYGGVSCDMDAILDIAKKYKLYLIEDAAQAILSTYKGRPLGSIGDLATLSFHETKNIHCGEGGALLINNSKFIQRAKIIKDKGTNRDLFNQNMVKKYTWIDYGSSYGLSEINAIYLYSLLKQTKTIIKKRIGIYNRYQKLLENLEINKMVKRPIVPEYAKHNAHIYFILISKKIRSKLLQYLKKKNINSAFHYIPLHSSPFGRKMTISKFSMKNTNYISNCLLRLPMHIKLKERDILKVCEEIKIFFEKKLYKNS